MGLIYGLIAAGLAVIWGVTGLVNFAHGAYLVVAMYVAYWSWRWWHLDPTIGVLVDVPVMFALGVGTYWATIRPVRQKSMLIQMVVTFGLYIALQGMAQFLWGPDYRLVQHPLAAGFVEVLGLRVGRPQLIAAAVCLATYVVLFLWLERSQAGITLRATAEDARAVNLCGVSPDKVFAVAWGVGLACVGVAGAMMANFYYIYPTGGFLFGLISFVVVALAGFGSITATLPAGLIVGLVESVVAAYFSAYYSVAAIFGVFVILLALRPQGLMGRK